MLVWGTGPIGLPVCVGSSTIVTTGSWWAEEKIGRDAGDLAGTAKTGTIATDDASVLLP